MSSKNIKGKVKKLTPDLTEKSKKKDGNPKIINLKRIIDQSMDKALSLDHKLTQFERIDFYSIAFTGNPREPNIPNRRLMNKHFIVITIENVLKIASKNNWNLVMKNNSIYSFNGDYWGVLDKGEFINFLGNASIILGVNKITAKHYEFKEKLYKQFMSTAFLKSPKIDVDKVLINLKNGTFEITSTGGYLRDFNKSDFLTYQLGFDFNPKSTAPIFTKYLDEVLPEKESQMVLQEYLGYIFIKNGSRNLKEEKVLLLYGSGANGKSVFFEVIMHLLGTQNTSNFSLQSLTNESGYYRAKISDKLVNYTSEIGTKLDIAIFKQMVSGEPVEARLPYSEPFTMEQYAKLMFNSNVLPTKVEQTNAYFRRFLIVPFNVTIPKEKQDKTLHLKIIENELSGVFNWVIEGLNRLLKNKSFTESKAIDNAIEEYRIQSDSVKLYIQDNCSKSVSNFTKVKDLYTDYRTYCINDGLNPVSKQNFIKRLKDAKVIIERKNVGNVAYLTLNLLERLTS